MLQIGEFARLGQVSPRMLRHYDELALLKPAHVDARTGYRGYEVGQLARLHRLIALRELGLSLDQVREVLDEEPPVDQLRGMLRLRRAELEADMAEQQARFRRIDAHLRALEGSDAMPVLDVVVKTTDAVTIAEAVGTAPGFGHPNIGPVFEELVPRVLRHLGRVGVAPGIMIAWYEGPADDGSIVVHAGFQVSGRGGIADDDGMHVVDLPVVRVASVVHRGPMDDIATTYEALVRWIDDSGYRLAGRSRELYLEWDGEHPERNVTELQIPLAS
jgi:DNA-binding transcriptional MerR regulator/predicted transcriptional regulator YdeE